MSDHAPMVYLDLTTGVATVVRPSGDDSITVTGVTKATANDAVFEASGGQYSLVDALHPDHGWHRTGQAGEICHVLES